MITFTTRRILAATAAVALAGLTVGASPASAGVSSIGEFEFGLFYSNDEYAMFTGPPFDQGCLGEGFRSVASHIVETPSGISSERASGENLALLYDLEAEGASSGLELLEIACAALEAGEPMPVPIAEGTTADVLHLWEGRDRGHAKASSVGTLETPDGQKLKVHGRFRGVTTSTEDPADHDAEFETETEFLAVHPVG